MKIKVFLSAVLMCVLTFIVTASPAVYGQGVLDEVCSTTPNATVCQDKDNNVTPENNEIYGANGLLTRIAKLIATAVGAASVIMIIVGGFKYVLSSGDPSQANSAKNTVLFAIIGLIIALLARAIISFVLTKV